ncbi:MBL fold metallo-hydrolase [Roseixanthobacter glucoisosaccharinicivorans]|uniref:MBL fold metallo-hydrolase n=1 Tax=Roseixanthobacter glucoisosaccharinicivorans TaxID=3119923 RepID=UPI003729E3FF
MRQIAALFGAIALIAFPMGNLARAAEPPEKCPRMVAQNQPWTTTPRVWRAAFRQTAQAKPTDAGRQVRLTFVGHSTFLIESPAGVTIATDYNDYVRPAVVPMIATMNRAHDTHYTNHPDPGIAYVLRGWGENGQPAHYDLTVEDVWIRNVPTNIRHGAGTDYDANSMFVFEVAGLCIAHLGHLHHVLTPDHLEALGRIDVVLAPVDGSYTLDIEGMKETLKAINAPLVIPMHYFSAWGLDNFLSRLGNDYAITRQASPSVILSRETLPAKPTVLVLPGR